MSIAIGTKHRLTLAQGWIPVVQGPVRNLSVVVHNIAMVEMTVSQSLPSAAFVGSPYMSRRAGMPDRITGTLEAGEAVYARASQEALISWDGVPV